MNQIISSLIWNYILPIIISQNDANLPSKPQSYYFNKTFGEIIGAWTYADPSGKEKLVEAGNAMFANPVFFQGMIP